MPLIGGLPTHNQTHKANGSDPVIAFKRVQREAGGTYTSTNAAFTEIDSTNLTLTLRLAINDVVRLEFCGQTYNSGASGANFDFNVIQPSAGTVRANNSSLNGAAVLVSANRSTMAYTAYFIATEAGNHTFRPVWKVGANTQTLSNSSSADADQTGIAFSVQNLGPSA